MGKWLLCGIAALGLLTGMARATTWDEPWHDSVVREADSFVRVKVVKADPAGSTVELVKWIAGEKVPATFTLKGFSALRLMSFSAGHGPEYRFRKGDEYYLMLKKNKGGGYSLPTPTAGAAYVAGGDVHATYTHSYYQALVPVETYENSMQAIFERLHGRKVDETYVQDLIRKYLTQPPQSLKAAGNDRKKADLFFRQHVALECFRYFGKADEVKLLEPFLATDGRFVQISAVRAEGRFDTPAARRRLLTFLENDKNSNFARVLAVWELRRRGARELLPALKAFLPKASEEETGFGGNIMDPRVGTQFPGSVKSAVAELIAEWDKAPATQKADADKK